MNTLVIHPKDRTTAFLSDIYKGQDVTLVQGGVTRARLKNMIRSHDRTMMLGHGAPNGLMSVGQFEGAYAIDHTFVEVLAEKDDHVYIWCHADSFVDRYQLCGFYTGMFISDGFEAWAMGVDASSWQVRESNLTFALAVGQHSDPGQMYDAAGADYADLALVNPVAKYNYDRLCYASCQT